MIISLKIEAKKRARIKAKKHSAASDANAKAFTNAEMSRRIKSSDSKFTKGCTQELFSTALRRSIVFVEQISTTETTGTLVAEDFTDCR